MSSGRGPTKYPPRTKKYQPWTNHPREVHLAGKTPRISDGRLFPWQSRHSVYKWLRPLVRTLGLSYTPHLSRHAMATDLYREGRERKRTAERGIWRDERSVDRYIHHRAVDAPERGARRVLAGVKKP